MTEIFDPEKLAEKLATGAFDKIREAQGGQKGDPGKIVFPLSSFHEFGRTIRARYVVKGLIPHGCLAVVWGPPKCGKSFWTMDLALHVALGREYRGHRVSQGVVIYLALEGEHGFKARRDAFARRFLEPDDDPPFWLMTTQIDLRKQVRILIRDITAQLSEDKPSLIVVDTLNRSLIGSESKDEDMGDYIRAADMIRAAFDCAVLIVHHCGINGERPRGHTSLTGAVDAQLAVRRDEESGVVAVTVEHMKDGDFGEVVNSRLEVVELDPDDDGDPVTSLVVVPADGPTTKQKKERKLAKGALLALRALHEAIADHGRIPDPDGHIPDNVKVVTLDQREIATYQRGITKSDRADSRRKAFVRAGELLIERGKIGIWQPYVWPARGAS
jgi:hypothetical protein